jgi:hypothetical protein
MDNEREQERRTYQLCRMGFSILAFALVVACLPTLIDLPRHFGARGFLPWLRATTWWRWVDLPIVWGSLLGTYLLWGRWTDASWQRRTGLLLVMGLVDFALWGLDHASDLGVRLGAGGELGHLWLRQNLGMALGWAEFALIASLACEVLVHLGVEQAAKTGKATRSLATTGAVVWILLFFLQTDWRSGWPLEPRGILPLEALLLDLGSTMIWTVTLIQVTALTIAAARQCSGVLAEMTLEDVKNDPLKSASEKDFGDLNGFVTTRSDGDARSSGAGGRFFER